MAVARQCCWPCKAPQVSPCAGPRLAPRRALPSVAPPLQEGMEKAAAALESRRYLAMLGGTTEFSK